MDKILQFTNYLKNVGIPDSKLDKITNWFIQYQRDMQVQQQSGSENETSSDLIEQYCEQIVVMFKNYPELTIDTYKNYLKLVFEKLLNLSKEA